MRDFTTKVVKVPVRIVEEDKDLRILKYRALDEIMREVRYLGNMAIRYAIAFKLDGIPGETEGGKPVALDTRIYRILARKRKYLDAGTVATLSRNFAVKALKSSDKDAWEGKKSLPTYRSLFLPFRHQGSVLTQIKHNGQTQFIIEPPFGRKWLSDDLVQTLEGNLTVGDDQRKLTLASCFSWKDKGARDVVTRITSGEYLMSDSQIKKSGKDLIVYLTYRFKQVQPELDPEKVCGVALGAGIPAVCAVNFGPQRIFVGNGADLWAARAKFRAERRRKERRLGHRPETSRWKRSEKEDRWLRTYYHVLTKEIIGFCLRHGCGKIKMALGEKLNRSERMIDYGRLVWAPSKFYGLLEYKAKEAGIATVSLNAQNVSHRCSECGHLAQENRQTPSAFACVKCGGRANADYNCARNIALASGQARERGYSKEA